MKLPTFVLFLLLAYVSLGSSREITHEDIKDAMLSLVHMMRENNEKLERHEARERQLGESLKKAIAILSKRVAGVDSVKNQLSKLDDRINGIEQLMAQRDERERIQMQKTADTLEDLESRLEGWLTDIETKVSEVNNRTDSVPEPGETISDVMYKLNTTELLLNDRVLQLESAMRKRSERLQEEVAAHKDKTHSVLSEMKGMTAKINDLETVLREVKEISEKVEEKPEDRQQDIIGRLEDQTKTLERVQEILTDTSDKIRDLPRPSEAEPIRDEMRRLMEDTKRSMENVVTRAVDDIETKMIEETKDTIGTLRMDLADSTERFNQELRDLSKGLSVMVSMADHVLDTKKRIEYGVHQILLEVGDLVKAQGANINNTLNQRFDGISVDIMDNHNGALANLTTKIEQELNQVWRQINVMYQQMTESSKALNEMRKQNEEYVNGTTSTMTGMESTVGEITKRMSEVDENLNYLLGRLSLVTQEFNQIKTGLGTALDNIKASFKEVQEKANDLSHPGPHPVPENYEELNEHESNMATGKPSPEIISHIFSHQTN